MKNFKKVLALVLAFAMVLSTMTVAFAANANEAEAKVLYDLDLFDGKNADEYEPALEDAATAPEALKLIGTALGWEIDPDATTTFEDVPAWAQPWVAYAVEAGITNGVSETEFGVNEIDGKRVVTWFLRALGYDMTEAWEMTEELAAEAGLTIPATTSRDDVVGVIYEGLMATPVDGDATLIEMIILGDAELTMIAEKAGLVADAAKIISAVATGVKTVEVKLNKAVDTDTTKVTVKKGAAIYSKSVEWNDAMNMATVTTVIDLPDADYTAFVTTATETLEFDFVVADEAAATIEITDLVLEDETEEAEVAFVVNNQYGEDMGIDSDDTDLTVVAYNVTQGFAVDVTTDSEAYFVVDTTDNADEDEEDAFQEGDIVRFTVSYLGMTAQANVTVIDAAASSIIVFGDIELVDEDDTMLNAEDDVVIVAYTLLDQYGEEVELSETSETNLPATIDGVQFISSDEDVIDAVEVYENDDEDMELRFTVVGDGTAIITAVVNESGAVANTSIVVNEDTTVDEVVITAPTEVVAQGDDALELEIEVLDQYGEAIDYDDYNGLIAFDVEGIEEGDVTLSEDMIEISLDNVDADGDDVTITVIGVVAEETEDDEYGDVTFTVEETAYASEIDDIDMAFLFEDSATLDIYAADLEVVDQYGRDFDVDDADFSIAFEDEDTTSSAIVTIEAKDTDEDGDMFIQLDTEAVDEDTEDEITLTLTVDNGDLADEITFDFDIEVINSDDIDSYAMSEVGLVYYQDDLDNVDTDYVVEVTIEGLADGETVNLIDDVPDVLTSSDLSVATVDGDEVTGVEEGDVTISVWMAGDKVDSETVTVSEEAPYAVTVTIDQEDDDDTLADIVTVEDQYEVEIDTVLYYYVDDEAADEDDLLTSFDADVELKVITSNGITETATINE